MDFRYFWGDLDEIWTLLGEIGKENQQEGQELDSKILDSTAVRFRYSVLGSYLRALVMNLCYQLQ